MKHNPVRVAVTVAGLAAGAMLGASCSNDEKGLGDAPVDQQDDRTVKVWPNADWYPNVAGFCIGGNGVYSTTREAPPVIVAADPECAAGGILAGSGAAPDSERSVAEENEDEG